ncbi:MAG: lipid-A-disaccharide synthase [Lentisphaeria bacterium]|nr:lipid-A-disaccharide synthase [Lentisphaeria bacterium]
MSKPPTIWILAGEASGDLYGGRLAVELKRLSPDITVKGMGMGAMRKAGVDLLVDSSDLGVIGFVEVFKRLPAFFKIFKGLVRQAEKERPDCVVMVDYPGFNLRFAKQMHRRGIPVVYYISPQVWIWGKKRIPKIAAWCDKVLAIFPFEPAVYDGTGLDVQFVGHPLVDIIDGKKDASIQRDPNLLLLLPGSRRQEILRLLPPIAETAARLSRDHPKRCFALPVPSPEIRDLVADTLADLRDKNPSIPDVTIVEGDASSWFQKADAGLATSGTVTMEAAIYGLPLVSIYKVSAWNYAIGKLLIKLDYFTIVNLVAGKRVFDEFLQGDVRADVLAPAVEAILTRGERRDEVMQGIADCVAALGGGRGSCERAAREALKTATSAGRPRRETCPTG